MCRALPPQLQVGVEFEASTRMQDTSASFGYQLDLPKANFLFKGKEGLSFPPGKQTGVTQLPVCWGPLYTCEFLRVVIKGGHIL